jgi:predicted  nucleic acid-binding Zn-ribbon protein
MVAEAEAACGSARAQHNGQGPAQLETQQQLKRLESELAAASSKLAQASKQCRALAGQAAAVQRELGQLQGGSSSREQELAKVQVRRAACHSGGSSSSGRTNSGVGLR